MGSAHPPTWTPERDALLRVEYLGGRRTSYIREMLNALPGRPITDDAIRQRANAQGWRRSDEFRVPVDNLVRSAAPIPQPPEDARLVDLFSEPEG